MPRRGPGPGPKPGPGRTGKKSRRQRRRRRRVIVGGAVVLAGAHHSRKLKKEDAAKIEEHTGVPVEELEEDELDKAISELGIQEEPVTAEDEAALANAGE